MVNPEESSRSVAIIRRNGKRMNVEGHCELAWDLQMKSPAGSLRHAG